MKHTLSDQAEYLAQLLVQLGLDVGVEAQASMLAHLDWVLEWNERVNLTSITDPTEAIRLHIADSLSALPAVDDCPPGALCDIGSGAGYPGIPLALATQRPTILVESIRKKAAVVSQFVAANPEFFSSRVATESVRVEELAESHKGNFAVVTARAVSRLSSLVELASPLLLRGGSLVALKGELSADEYDQAVETARLTGMKIRDVRRFTLPEKHESRTLVTVTKERESETALPRRIGLAQRSPLTAVPRSHETRL